MILYLWNSTVRTEIPRQEAIFLVEYPSARSWKTPRCRGVSEATGPPGSLYETTDLRVLPDAGPKT
jgi:hypothetical protein